MTTWKQQVKEGYILVSPTYLSGKCNRKALMQTMKNENNIHFAYGHAFGTAAAYLYEFHHKPKEVRLGRALLEGNRYMSYIRNLAEPHISGKSMGKLWTAINIVDVHAQQIMKGMKFHSAEKRIILKLHCDDGTVCHLGGSYDLCLEDYAGYKHIYDFKAVTSGFLYSWPSEPQIPFYLVINQVASNVLKLGEEYSPHGAYFVHETKNEDRLYRQHKILSSIYVRHLKMHMEYAINKAKELGNFAASDLALNKIPLQVNSNLNECKRNGFDCDFYHECHGFEWNFEPEEYVDDRDHSNIVTIDCTEQDIMNAVDQIAAIAQEDLDSKHNEFNSIMEVAGTEELLDMSGDSMVADLLKI